MKKNPLIPKIPRKPRMPKIPQIPSPQVPAPMNGPTQAPPDMGVAMAPISQGKVQMGGFKPKKGGMF